MLSLYRTVHLLSKWLRGIFAITYSNDDSTPPWNVPHWIFSSAKVFSTQRFFIMNFVRYLLHWDNLLSSFARPCRIFSGVNPRHNIFLLVLFSWGCVDPCIVDLLFLLLLCGLLYYHYYYHYYYFEFLT